MKPGLMILGIASGLFMLVATYGAMSTITELPYGLDITNPTVALIYGLAMFVPPLFLFLAGTFAFARSMSKQLIVIGMLWSIVLINPACFPFFLVLFFVHRSAYKDEKLLHVAS